ncbi:hypothetical protein KR054_002917, partial [Drosophila jambulina]
MKELLENNFNDEMTTSEFRKAVNMVTKPWSVSDGPTVKVTLEVSEGAKLDVGRVYINWFSFRC